MEDVQITARENGPYLVKGPISLVDSDGNAYDVGGKELVVLCRCGHSANKPFCDGAHAKLGFTATERAKA